MAVTTTLLRTMARQHRRPEQILLQVNDALAVQNPHGMFVTLMCLIVDPATGAVSCASAGPETEMIINNPRIDKTASFPNFFSMIVISSFQDLSIMGKFARKNTS
jgi:hypothetical protein